MIMPLINKFSVCWLILKIAWPNKQFGYSECTLNISTNIQKHTVRCNENVHGLSYRTSVFEHSFIHSGGTGRSGEDKWSVRWGVHADASSFTSSLSNWYYLIMVADLAMQIYFSNTFSHMWRNHFACDAANWWG